ncbi:MAG: SPOR domain-containing protein [Caldimonas sp.]
MFKKQSDPPATAKAEPADSVQQARTRARHRLIGAIVLLAVGIIGFPLVFETQPRPVPVDIPIEIPRRDAMPPLVMPSAPAPTPAPTPATTPAPRTPVMTESSADAGRDVTPAVPVSAAERPSRPALAASAPAVPPAPRAAAASVPRAGDDGERARALLEGRPPAATEGQRFVVQVGAFADAEAAREARKQVEKLGMKTYTQVAQTPGGSRIRVRVGPFVTRAEAEAALAKAKASGLSAVVLTL